MLLFFFSFLFFNPLYLFLGAILHFNKNSKLFITSLSSFPTFPKYSKTHVEYKLSLIMYLFIDLYIMFVCFFFFFFCIVHSLLSWL